MKQILTYVVIALVGIAIGALATSTWFTPDPVRTVEYDTVTEVKVDSTRIKYLQEELAKAKSNVKEKKVTIKVPVPVVKHDTVYVDSVDVATTKYTGSEKLDNATVYFEIYADSLLAYNFKVETETQTITKTVTEYVPPRNVFMVGGGLNYNGGLSSAEAGLMYNIKQKWQIGVVVQHDLTGILPPDLRTSVGVRAYFKL